TPLPATTTGPPRRQEACIHSLYRDSPGDLHQGEGIPLSEDRPRPPRPGLMSSSRGLPYHRDLVIPAAAASQELFVPRSFPHGYTFLLERLHAGQPRLRSRRAPCGRPATGPSGRGRREGHPWGASLRVRGFARWPCPCPSRTPNTGLFSAVSA